MSANIMDFLSQFLPLAGGLAGGAVQGIQQRQAYDQGQQGMMLAANADNRSAAASHREDMAAARAEQLFPGQVAEQNLGLEQGRTNLDTSKWRQKQAVADQAEEDAPLPADDPRVTAAKNGYDVNLEGKPAKLAKDFRAVPGWRGRVQDAKAQAYRASIINAITSLANKGIVENPDVAVLMTNPKFAALQQSRAGQQQLLQSLVQEAIQQGILGPEATGIGAQPGAPGAAAPAAPGTLPVPGGSATPSLPAGVTMSQLGPVNKKHFALSEPLEMPYSK